MAKKILLLAAAIAVPGGLIALAIAWIGTRPDMQEKLASLWYRVSRTPRPVTDMDRSNVVCLVRAQVIPMSASRCRDTAVFRSIRLAA
ncbi:MAG: hypothetical protein ABI321_24885 [Polyangia bacterium]